MRDAADSDLVVEPQEVAQPATSSPCSHREERERPAGLGVGAGGGFGTAVGGFGTAVGGFGAAVGGGGGGVVGLGGAVGTGVGGDGADGLGVGGGAAGAGTAGAGAAGTGGGALDPAGCCATTARGAEGGADAEAGSCTIGFGAAADAAALAGVVPRGAGGAVGWGRAGSPEAGRAAAVGSGGSSPMGGKSRGWTRAGTSGPPRISAGAGSTVGSTPGRDVIGSIRVRVSSPEGRAASLCAIVPQPPRVATTDSDPRSSLTLMRELRFFRARVLVTLAHPERLDGSLGEWRHVDRLLPNPLQPLIRFGQTILIFGVPLPEDRVLCPKLLVLVEQAGNAIVAGQQCRVGRLEELKVLPVLIFLVRSIRALGVSNGVGGLRGSGGAGAAMNEGYSHTEARQECDNGESCG